MNFNTFLNEMLNKKYDVEVVENTDTKFITAFDTQDSKGNYHAVDVVFLKNPDDEWLIEYIVDGNVTKKKDSGGGEIGEYVGNILAGVRQSFEMFIKEKKPKKIKFEAYHPKLVSLYKRMIPYIEKLYKYKINNEKTFGSGTGEWTLNKM